MKTAKDLFEELGFHGKLSGDDWYYNNGNKEVCYIFNATFKDVNICDDYNCYCLTPKLVRAIYKQCEELGWFEDE